MPLLVDTNILIRLRDAGSPHHLDCRRVLLATKGRPGELVACAQVFIEYWTAATRPMSAVNGLGLTPAQAADDLVEFERVFPILPEPPDVYAGWRNLVTRYGVSGRPAHDARLVALMAAHGVTRLLTLNPRDFSRYAPDGLTCVAPADFLAGRPA